MCFRAPNLSSLKLSKLRPFYPHGPAQAVVRVAPVSFQFYVLRLTSGEDATPLTEAQIATKLLDIVTDAKKSAGSAGAFPVGTLTSQRRDDWAHSRELLAKSAANRNNLALIERCLFVVNFDLEALGPEFNAACKVGARGHRLSNGRDETNMMHQMMHGGGSEYCSGNRWFDKTVQVKSDPTLSLVGRLFGSRCSLTF